MMSISRNLDIPLVAACDCRYIADDDYAAYRVLQSIRTGTTLDKLNAESPPPPVAPLFHSSETMEAMFGDCPEALANTVDISDRCNVELPLGG